MRQRPCASLGSAIAMLASVTLVACGGNPAIPMAALDLNGTISDASTHAGIPGAIVQVYEAQTLSRSEVIGTAKTDATGHYVLWIRSRNCFDSLIAIGVSADGYQSELNGYGFDPPDQSPHCLSTPQTLNIALRH
jgi:hypothetical protein